MRNNNTGRMRHPILALLVPATLALQLPVRLPATARAHVRACDSVDRQLSSEKLITFAEQDADMQALITVALQRLDRNRLLQGKPKYESLDGMIESYMNETSSRGFAWTPEEAESEVVRYLRKQALADEGGLDGPSGGVQDKATFAFLGVTIVAAAAGFLTQSPQ